MLDTLRTTLAGLAAGIPSANPVSDLLPLILGFMDGSPAIIALNNGMRDKILTTLASEHAAGRLGLGTMPDTFNRASRVGEWERTSNSLVPYLEAFDGAAMDGARVTSVTVEAVEGILVRLVLARAHGDPVEMVLDPVALERLEAALR